MEVERIATNLEIGALRTVICRHSSWIRYKKTTINNFPEIRRSEPKNERPVLNLNISTPVIYTI
jgi:hypothetical protein